MRIKVVCTWGDVPDILMEIQGPIFILNDELGTKKGWNEMEFQLDLTQKEARELATQLIEKADYCKYLEDELNILNHREME